MADFLGKNIGISDVHLAGSEVTFTVVYQDKDGVVHGHMKHSLPLTDNQALRTAASGLLEALKGAAQKAHFTGTSTSTREERAHGIAEALRDAAAPAVEPDEDGI